MSEAKDADVDRLTLLPCPFCGAAAKLKSKPRLAIPNMTYWVGCKTPNCPGDQVWEKIRAEAAIEAWNSRLSLSQEAVRGEVLEEAARVADEWGSLRTAKAIRAIKREPNAAAKIGQSYEVMGIEQTSAPPAPDVAEGDRLLQSPGASDD